LLALKNRWQAQSGPQAKLCTPLSAEDWRGNWRESSTVGGMHKRWGQKENQRPLNLVSRPSSAFVSSDISYLYFQVVCEPASGDCFQSHSNTHCELSEEHFSLSWLLLPHQQNEALGKMSIWNCLTSGVLGLVFAHFLPVVWLSAPWTATPIHPRGH
jgi:hypothetical protein